MNEYYKNEVKDIFKKLNTSETGLKESEIKTRLNKYGKNKLEEKKKKSKFIKFLEQFKNLMVLILIGAAILSFIIALEEGESFTECYIIITIIFLNAILGYIQESKADAAIEKLQKMSSTHVKVRRNKEVKLVDVLNLVPGDILVLEAGDYIPADARLFYVSSLKVEEASLTGESGSVTKNIDVIKENVVINDRKNMIYSGSSVVYGKCEAVIIGTAMDTELGKIAKSLADEKNVKTPLQKKIDNISKVLTIIIGIVIAIMVIVGIINGMDLLSVFVIAISLAVAAIPEGLPTVITIILSLGMTKLAKKKAVVRQISSVETLGSTEVICSDKTGTITKNEMTVRKFYLNNEITDNTTNEKMIQIMMLCNDVNKDGNKFIGDATEIALYKYVLDNSKVKFNKKRIYEFPFDSDRKLMSVITNDNQDNLVLTKGSLTSMLEICNKILIGDKVKSLTQKYKNDIFEKEKLMSDEALRILAFGYKNIKQKKEYNIKETESDLIFVGLVGMIDPPRGSVKKSIEKCLLAGIRPIMITGDSINTAKAIAKEVGIYKDGDLAIEGVELENISDEELKKNVHKYSVYARVTPEHKLRIVKAWKANNKIVSMTGDGVNDAPALKTSDVGVGMGIAGTEVSKNVSDIVLLDDSFNTIVIAVEEGRNIFENIRKAVCYLLTANIAEIIIVFIATMFSATIFGPIHLLYINLVTDSLPAIALSFEKNDKDIMKRKPRKNKSSLFTSFLTSRIVISAVLKSIAVLILYFTSLHLFGALTATTIAFLGLIMMEMTFALTSRNLYDHIFNKEFFSNKIMNFTMILLIVLQLIIFLTPAKNLFDISSLTLLQFIYVLIYVFTIFIINEALKPILIKIFKDE